MALRILPPLQLGIELPCIKNKKTKKQNNNSKHNKSMQEMRNKTMTLGPRQVKTEG